MIFKYPETVHDHCQHRDDMDSHNASWQATIALEDTYYTKPWENRVFLFLLDLSEVNANLGSTILMACRWLGQFWSSED